MEQRSLAEAVDSHVEVKAGRNLKARSLSVYRELLAPSSFFRASLEQYNPDGAVKDYPLYALKTTMSDMKEIKRQ